MLMTTAEMPTHLRGGFYAAHVVAATIMSAMAQGANLASLFDRMITLLKVMHDQNPSWGPLFVRHPGDLAIHRSYIRGAMTQVMNARISV
jgi:hypothetical protein